LSTTQWPISLNLSLSLRDWRGHAPNTKYRRRHGRGASNKNCSEMCACSSSSLQLLADGHGGGGRFSPAPVSLYTGANS
jgi:hypothetical protein